MKKNQLLLLLLLFATTTLLGQSVGIGESKFIPVESAALEIRATNKGLLIPKLTDQQRNTIQNPIEGLLIYQVNLVPGFYFYTGTNWERLGSFYVDYDTDSLNELQTLRISNDTIYLSDGGAVKLPITEESQTIALVGDSLSITKGNTISLSKYLDNTDNQTLQIIGDSLKIANGNAVSLSKYLDNVNQQLTRSNDTLFLSNGGVVKLPNDEVNDADADSTNELQMISISNDTLFLSKGNFVVLPPDLVDDADADTTNELQQLSLSNDSIYISDGNFIVLPADNVTDADADSTNELQQLTLSNDSIFISDGNYVVLPNDEVNDLDADTTNEIQQLTFANDSISISKGNKIDLAALKDNLGNHILSQNLQLNGFAVGNDSTPSFFIDADGKVVFLKGTSIQNNFNISDTLVVNSSVYLNQRVYINQDDPDHSNLPTQVPDELTVVGDHRIYDDNIGYANPDFARITFDDPSSALNDGILNIYTPHTIEFGKISQSQQSNGSTLMRINDDGTVLINDQYNLPNNDGNKRQVLTTNGNDTAYWENIGALDTLSVESGSFIAFAGHEYLMDGNFVVTVTLPNAANHKGKKIRLYAYQYDALNGFFFNVSANSTSILSVADNNQIFTTDNEFGVISSDKTITLISNGVHWVLLGAKD